MRAVVALMIVAGALGWPAPGLAEPEVEVTLDASPREARVGETIRLEARVRTKGGSIEHLKLEDLKKYPELELISHRTVRPMQFSFAFGSGVQVESSVANVYVLRANAPGEYAFSPAVATVDGKTYKSEPITVLVREGVGQSATPDTAPTSPDGLGEVDLSGAQYDDRAFLRTVVEPKEAYVGEQVSVTVYLYTRLRLGPQSLVPGKPAMDGFWVYDDPITSLQAQTVTVRGARYQVYALHRSVAFPQRVGELTIGAPSVTFDVAGGSFFDAPQRVQREGVPVTVDVKPLPTPVPANAVVGRYDLKMWVDRTAVATGDAVTLRVDATGVGNVQDLRIDLPPVVGVRALQPAIRDQQRLTGGKLAGARSWEWILIAEAPGGHEVPPVAIHYFDPETEQYASASAPSVTFTASGQARASQPAIEPAAPRQKPASAAFGPFSVYSALHRGEVPVRSRDWFGWLLAFPPLAFGLLVFAMSLMRRREQRSTTTGAVQRRLVRSAQSALESEDPRAFYDRIVSAITHALDARLGEPVGALPHAELRARLARAGFDDDLVDRVINELEGADFARFAASGVNKDEMRRCLQRTGAIIERVQRAKGSS